MRTILRAVYSSLIVAFLFSGSALLVGCHTAEGVGKDTKSVGNAVEGAAKDARD
jgi:predicted small secreted protein